MSNEAAEGRPRSVLGSPFNMPLLMGLSRGTGHKN